MVGGDLETMPGGKVPLPVVTESFLYVTRETHSVMSRMGRENQKEGFLTQLENALDGNAR